MKKLLYLRTDIIGEQLTAGGSVAHTVGVIHGFKELGWQITCAASCMQPIIRSMQYVSVTDLHMPRHLKFLRWKLNSFMSTVVFFRQIQKAVDVTTYDAIYQRYSILNATGLLLAWWYKKSFVLEFNGSEVWVMDYWSTHKKWIQFRWLIRWVELLNVKHATLIVVVSEPLQEMLVQHYKIPLSKILVNPNGVDTQMFKPSLS